MYCECGSGMELVEMMTLCISVVEPLGSSVPEYYTSYQGLSVHSATISVMLRTPWHMLPYFLADSGPSYCPGVSAASATSPQGTKDRRNTDTRATRSVRKLLLLNYIFNI
jgi:hypothetical protein